MSQLDRELVYTRVSTEHGLEQEFNSLDSQREASEAYIKSQAHEGWRCLPARYDDGGFSGGSMERPALQRLLGEIRSRRIDVIVVYKVDRLTRSLTDFAKLVELFDAKLRTWTSPRSAPIPLWTRFTTSALAACNMSSPTQRRSTARSSIRYSILSRSRARRRHTQLTRSFATCSRRPMFLTGCSIHTLTQITFPPLVT